MNTTNYAELVSTLCPEIALTIGLLVVLFCDLTFGRRMNDCSRRSMAMVMGIITLAFAIYLTWTAKFPETNNATVFHGAFVYDLLAAFTRLGVYALSALTLLLVTGSCSKQQRTFANPAEYVAIQLLATMGFSLMAVSNNLLSAFLGLELASLSLYIMAGFNKTSRESAEAGLKYFLFGGMAAAFMLFGFSLIYGLTGSLSFIEISRALAVQGLSPLLLVALVMVLVGFGYKAAAAPFHMWAPDVYQGAPAPAAALIASASKLAGVVLFTRMLWIGFGSASGSFDTFNGKPGWIPVLILLSAASLLLGNIAALAQTNVRRLFAYSAISHAGAMIIAVIVGGTFGSGPIFYYIFTYGLATIGVFGVFAAVERATPNAPAQRISDLAGLWKRSPFLAGVLFICVLSLAGVPPLAGFFGKFYVFAGALSLNGLTSLVGWLVLLAIAMSAVGLYYYLVVLKAALVSNANSDNSEKIRTPVSTAIALVIICALTIAAGIFPSVILELFK